MKLEKGMICKMCHSFGFNSDKVYEVELTMIYNKTVNIKILKEDGKLVTPWVEKYGMEEALQILRPLTKLEQALK